jgi:hypothetical protein
MQERGESVTVVETIEEVIEKMCSDYCKYPEEYTKKYGGYEGTKKMIEDHCDKCPLNRLN